jgi:hypothetical protein
MANGNGRHICRGLKGDGEPRIREYASFVCSMCGGNFAVELPEDDDFDHGRKPGEVVDKRRFVQYLDPNFKEPEE